MVGRGSARATAPGPRRPRPRARCAGRSGGARSPRSRAPPRTDRGARWSRRRTRRGTPRSQSSAAGRKPSPRLASVVGQAHTVVPRLRQQVELARRDVRGMHDGRRGPEHAAVDGGARSAAGRTPRATRPPRAAARRRGCAADSPSPPRARRSRRATRAARRAASAARSRRSRADRPRPRRRGARRARGRPRRCGSQKRRCPAPARGPRRRARTRPAAARCARRPRAPPR